MDKRPVDPDFIQAMETRLEHGRKLDRNAWEVYWKGFDIDEMYMNLMEMLQEHFYEFMDETDESKIKEHAADLANLAMMVADVVEHVMKIPQVVEE